MMVGIDRATPGAGVLLDRWFLARIYPDDLVEFCTMLAQATDPLTAGLNT
jgi:hypothetical protein